MSVSVERKGNEATLKFTIPVEEVAKGFRKSRCPCQQTGHNSWLQKRKGSAPGPGSPCR